MKRNTYIYNVYKSFFVLTAFVLTAAAPARAEEFPVPDIIKPNVAFWIRIYTEVGLKEGLIHDSEYPQVIYEKVVSGDMTGKRRSEHIDGRRRVYINAVNTVRDSSPDKWGATEKRVAELFKNAPEGALAGAESRVRHQTGQRERFRQGLERSGAYIDTIAAILKMHGVADELKYLPHVESSFDAEAYSKVGAAGLWQFMRSTGRGYMKIDYMFDERRDPIISTYAAAKFIRANYDMLKKWPLAVTAYNHGPNGIRRAVASVGSDDIAVILVKHESPSFKFASKNFYSCFAAVLQIMEKPEKYFSNIRYAPRFQATNIKLPFAIRADAICKSLGITEQQFQKLNPSLRPIVFTQNKPLPAGYGINLPITITADDAVAALNRTPPTQRPSPAEVVETDGYYTVSRGDNLNAIARRLGVSMAELAEVNNITNSSRIYVGQVLVVPSKAGGVQVAAVSKPSAAQRAAEQAATSKPTPPAPTKPTTETAPPVAVDTLAVVRADTVRIDTVRADTTITLASAKIDTAVTVKKKSSSSKKADTAKVDTKVKVDTTVKVAKADTTVKKVSSSKKTDTTKVDTKVKVDTTIKVASVEVKKVDVKKVSSSSKKTDTTKVDTKVKVDTTVKADTVKKVDTTVKVAKADTAVTPVPPTPTPTLPDSLAEVAFKEAEPVPVPISAPTLSDGRPSIDVDTRFDAAVYDLKIKVAPDSKSVRVRVLVDENIGRFAEWARVYVDSIRSLNDMAPGTGLQLGQMISLPIRSADRLKRFEVNRLQYHMAIEEDFFAGYNVTDFDRRRVKSGDNPWRICREAQIPMWLLQKYNKGVNIFALKAGETLLIPRIAAKDASHEAQPDFNPVITESDME